MTWIRILLTRHNSVKALKGTPSTYTNQGKITHWPLSFVGPQFVPRQSDLICYNAAVSCLS